MGRERCGFVGGRIVVLIEFSMELCLDDVCEEDHLRKQRVSTDLHAYEWNWVHLLSNPFDSFTNPIVDMSEWWLWSKTGVGSGSYLDRLHGSFLTIDAIQRRSTGQMDKPDEVRLRCIALVASHPDL